jgi:Zn finger protein HypA/HybF involved in hydrogenase expression
MTNRSKVYQVSDEEFKQIVADANSYSDCLRAVGLTTKGGSSTDILKRRIAELNCSVEHFGKKTQSPNARYTLDEILIENSTYANISRLKSRLINEERLEYKCALCGNTGEWQGQKLTLQLDHINGKNNDHRIENLRFLCPNCHSITETYAGKNKGA